MEEVLNTKFCEISCVEEQLVEAILLMSCIMQIYTSTM